MCAAGGGGEASSIGKSHYVHRSAARREQLAREALIEAKLLGEGGPSRISVYLVV